MDLKQQFNNFYKDTNPKKAAINTLFALGPGAAAWLLISGLQGRFFGALLFIGFVVAVNAGIALFFQKSSSTANLATPGATEPDAVSDSLHQEQIKQESTD